MNKTGRLIERRGPSLARASGAGHGPRDTCPPEGQEILKRLKAETEQRKAAEEQQHSDAAYLRQAVARADEILVAAIEGAPVQCPVRSEHHAGADRSLHAGGRRRDGGEHRRAIDRVVGHRHQHVGRQCGPGLMSPARKSPSGKEEDTRWPTSTRSSFAPPGGGKLKQLGYDVIPLYAKDAPYKGWPKMPNDEAAIADWSGAGAAVRMRGSELLVIDLDVHVAAARDLMLAWMGEHHPEFMAKCLRRHSGAISIALIGRTVTAKGTQKTARYVGEGTDPKGDFVEIFTGNSKKYVGVVGRHSEGREYDYHGRHITETPVDALPWLADSEIAPMLGAFEEIMAGCGWEKVRPTIGNEAVGTKVYDLLPDQIFTLADGDQAPADRAGGVGAQGRRPSAIAATSSR